MLPFFRFNVFFADSLRRLFIPDVQTPDTKPKIVGWTKKLLSEAIKADINHDGSFGKLKRYAKKDIWNHDHCSVLFSVFLLQKIWSMLHYPRLNYGMLSQFYSCQTQFLCNQNGGRASVEQASWSVLNNCSSKTKHARVQGCSDLAIFLLPLQYLNMFCSSWAHCGNANWVD